MSHISSDTSTSRKCCSLKKSEPWCPWHPQWLCPSHHTHTWGILKFQDSSDSWDVRKIQFRDFSSVIMKITWVMCGLEKSTLWSAEHLARQGARLTVHPVGRNSTFGGLEAMIANHSIFLKWSVCCGLCESWGTSQCGDLGVRHVHTTRNFLKLWDSCSTFSLISQCTSYHNRWIPGGYINT